MFFSVFGVWGFVLVSRISFCEKGAEKERLVVSTCWLP
jgi:hypothetical protein